MKTFQLLVISSLLGLSFSVAFSQDQSAILRVAQAPAFPVLARHASVSGSVLVEALISKDGKIGDVKILDGHPLLQESSLSAARKWLFSPCDTGVRVRMLFVYKILPRDTLDEEIATIFRSPFELEIRCRELEPETLPPTPKPDDTAMVD